MNIQGVSQTPDLLNTQREPIVRERDQGGSPGFQAWMNKGQSPGVRSKEEGPPPAQSDPRERPMSARSGERQSEQRMEPLQDYREKVDVPLEKEGATGVKKANMLKFMDSIEGELGVTPEQWLAAMMQLSKVELQLPPEETAAKVIQNLELSPADEERAMELYAGLLLASPKEVISPMAIPVASASGGFFLQNQMKNAENLSQLPAALGDDKLVSTGITGPLKGPAEQPEFVQKPLLDVQAMPTEESSLAEAPAEIAEGKQKIDLSSELVSPELTQLKEETFFPKVEMAQRQPSAMNTAKANTAGLLGQATSPEDFFKVAPELFPQAAVTAAAGREKDSQQEFSTGEDAKAAMEQLGAELSTQPGAREVTFAGALEQLAPEGMTLEDRMQNIQKLSESAELVARNGGGEAKIKLYPDGLGEVILKVLVKDGRVNVHMQTQSNEVKSLVESGLSDLKSHLAGHQLKMDQVRIEVNTGNDAGSAGRDNFSQSGSRGDSDAQTRQFFQQFRDQGFARRDQFLEIPEIRGYQRAQPSAPPLPGVLDNRPRYTGASRGQNMNLVA